MHTYAHLCTYLCCHLYKVTCTNTYIHHTWRYTKRKENEKIHKIIKSSASHKSNKKLIQMKIAIHETLHESVQNHSEQWLILLVLESWKLKQEEDEVKGILCSMPRVFLKRGKLGLNCIVSSTCCCRIRVSRAHIRPVLGSSQPSLIQISRDLITLLWSPQLPA